MPRKKRGSSSSPRGDSLEPGEIPPGKLNFFPFASGDDAESGFSDRIGAGGSKIGGVVGAAQDRPSIASIFGVDLPDINPALSSASRDSATKSAGTTSSDQASFATTPLPHHQPSLMTAFPTPEVRVKKRKISGKKTEPGTGDDESSTLSAVFPSAVASREAIHDDPPAFFSSQEVEGTEASPSTLTTPRGRGRPRGSRGRPRGSGRGAATGRSESVKEGETGGSRGAGRSRGRGRGRVGVVTGRGGRGGGIAVMDTSLGVEEGPSLAPEGSALNSSLSSDSSSPEKSAKKVMKSEKKKTFSPQKLPPQAPVVTSKRKEFMDCIHSEKIKSKKGGKTTSPEKIKIKQAPRGGEDGAAAASSTHAMVPPKKKRREDSGKAATVHDVVASAGNDFMDSDDEEKTDGSFDVTPEKTPTSTTLPLNSNGGGSLPTSKKSSSSSLSTSFKAGPDSPRKKLKIAPIPPPPPPGLEVKNVFSSGLLAPLNRSDPAIATSETKSQPHQPHPQPYQQQPQQKSDESMKLSPVFIQSPSSSHSFQSPPTSSSSFSPQPVLNPQPPPVKIVLKLSGIKQVGE